MTSRFTFRLQPILDHRQRILDDCQRELADKQRDLHEAQAAGTALEADRETQREVLTREHVRLNVDTLRATYAHLAYLDRAIEDQLIRVEACAAEVARAQAKLIEANTGRKILETLKLRRHETFAADAAQVEQRDVDDQNARRYGRAQIARGKEA